MNIIEQTWTAVIDPGFGEIAGPMIPDFTRAVEAVTRWAINNIPRMPLQAGGDLNTGRILVTFALRCDALELVHHADDLDKLAGWND